MTLAYASEELAAALVTLASADGDARTRLQAAWDDHVQMVWMKPCLTRELLREYRDVWQRYTAPSDDPRSTTLRDLKTDELTRAIRDLVTLAQRVAIAAATNPGEPLATLADL